MITEFRQQHIDLVTDAIQERGFEIDSVSTHDKYVFCVFFGTVQLYVDRNVI